MLCNLDGRIIGSSDISPGVTTLCTVIIITCIATSAIATPLVLNLTIALLPATPAMNLPAHSGINYLGTLHGATHRPHKSQLLFGSCNMLHCLKVDPVSQVLTDFR